MKKAIVLFGLVALMAGCAEEEPQAFQASDATGTQGPAVQAGSATEVWSVSNAWSDVDTANAAAAGVAWGEDSGLNWEQKYSAWVQSFGTVDGYSSGKSFSIPTPYGDRSFDAPTLDCAEVAYIQRIAFSSWYHLPFYVGGWDAEKRQTMFAGHFGFVTKTGAAYPGFTSFRDAYADHESSWQLGDEWPHDSKLRRRRLADDDENPFLESLNGEVTGAGAYLDELFLNKRVGHFARLLLVYFGSINLAASSNMFHVEADAIRAGDTLLKRTKSEGTGHTVPILNVKHPLEGKVAVEVASGNIPRRQPMWQDTLGARSRFLSKYYGGAGENSDGQPYASLGGGLRRWRTAVAKNGRWNNLILSSEESARIPESQLERIAQRTERFDAILLSGTPEERVATALVNITSSREHLLKYPASCSARIGREDAFEELYVVYEDQGKTRADADAEHRKLEDYVFGELVYEQSKTCCWNSTTELMAEVALDYAAKELADADAQQMCVEPTVFRHTGDGADGYDIWRQHAMSMGVGAQWVTWTEDEPCSQRDVSADTVQTSRVPTEWCAL
jgi:hypothetical protein